ncbi:hypothetical protein BsWGS_18714 [Bradybaena similaris]
MDFLLGLQKALALGVTRQEYTDIWKKEMDLKLSNKLAQDFGSQDVTSVDVKNDEAFTEKDPVIPLLKEIAEKQDMVQQQQTRIQQQLIHLQSLHEREQQKLQQQFEEAQKGLSVKVVDIEASLAKLQLTVTECVRKTVLSESLDIQEKLSVVTETLYNHMLEEMRNVIGDRKTVYKVQKSMEVAADKDSQMLEENTAKPVTARSERGWHSGSLNDLSVHNPSVEKISMPLLETEIDETSARNLCFTSDIVLKDILHHELNAFLVNVQKFLLKPINSEDVKHHVIERIKELLQCEKNLTTEQLLNVQTSISDDVQARLSKVEICFKNEISKIVSILEKNEQPHFQMNMVLEEIEKVQSFISSELPSRIMSHPKWASIFEKRDAVNVGGAMVRAAEANTAVRNEIAHKETESSHMDKLGRHKYWYTASENMQAFLRESEPNSEPVQAMMLMLSMYVLMLLTDYDPKARKETQGSSQPSKATDFLLYTDITGEHVEPEIHEARQKLGPQENDVLRHLTDDHLLLMFGQHKEAHFMCDLNYSTLSADEEVCFKLKEIAPGYNLQLKAFIDESKNVNFYIQSISGTRDDNLIWPADFNITIALVNKQPLTNFKSSHWSNFTKSKCMFKPLKRTGHSTFIPLCFFKDDIVHDFLYDNTLTFKMSVKYIRRVEETQE